MIHNTTYMGISRNFELVTALPIYDLDLKFSTRSSMPRDPNVDLPAALHLYLNHRRNRSNTKHVRDWHWFVEIDGNLVHKWHQKSMFKMTLPWKGVSLIWKGPIAYLVFGTSSTESALLDPMEWSAEKGIRRSRSQVPVNTFVSQGACTSLPCMFSLTLHLNLRHCDCLSADFISPVLLFSEASLWHWQMIAVAKESFHWPPPCELALFCLPHCWLFAVVSWSCFLAKYYRQHQQIQIPKLENHELNFSDALAMPERYPRDTLFSVPDAQVHISLWQIQVFWWQAR